MSMEILKWVLSGLIGYGLGTITTGTIVGRLMGVDIRQTGSKNAGTTNVLRTLGWKASLFTFAGDAVKGVLAVLIGRWIGGLYGGYLSGILAVIGHNWPVFFHFKGGKGIATSFGVILALNPLIALIMVLWQIAVVAVTKYMSVASISSAVVFSILTTVSAWGDWLQIVFALILSMLAIFCHRENIVRLIHHRENKLDFAKINALSRKK